MMAISNYREIPSKNPKEKTGFQYLGLIFLILIWVTGCVSSPDNVKPDSESSLASNNSNINMQSLDQKMVKIQPYLNRKDQFQTITSQSIYELIVSAYESRDFDNALKFIANITPELKTPEEKEIINELSDFAKQENIKPEVRASLQQANQKFSLKEYESAYELYNTILPSLNSYYKNLVDKNITICSEELFTNYFEKSKQLYEQKRWEECLEAIDSANQYKSNNSYLRIIKDEVEKNLLTIKTDETENYLSLVEQYVNDQDLKNARKTFHLIDKQYLNTTQNKEKYNEYSKKFKKSSVSSNMVFVEGGYFNRGSEDGDDDERPVRKIKLNSFYMSKFEITQKQYSDIMGNNPSYFIGDNLPVEKVTFRDAINFCNKLSIIDGFDQVYTIQDNKILFDIYADGYRLPTEAEWEYAAQSGKYQKNTLYSGSDNIYYVGIYRTQDRKQTMSVGSRSSNSLGIYDLSGNVWEWCWDWYSNDYYTHSEAENPTGPVMGNQRVIRGGSWFVSEEFCRIRNRSSRDPEKSSSMDGIRVVRNYIE